MNANIGAMLSLPTMHDLTVLTLRQCSLSGCSRLHVAAGVSLKTANISQMDVSNESDKISPKRLPISHQWTAATNWNLDYPRIVFANVPGYTAAVWVQLIRRPRFGFRPVQNPKSLYLGGLIPRLDIYARFSAGLEQGCHSNMVVSTTFAAIKYMSYDSIMT
jgi:hypothetical protein